MITKEKISLGIAIIAFAMSSVTFVQVQYDRTQEQKEEQPRIGFSYAPYGVEERYGFVIRNKGGKRARVPRIVYTYNDLPNGAVRAGELLKQLDMQDSGYFHLVAGSSYVIEPKTTQEMYTFSEELDENRQKLWAEYTKLLAADICYCDVDFRQCWTARISRRASQQVAEDFQCDAVEYRELLLAGTIR